MSDNSLKKLFLDQELNNLLETNSIKNFNVDNEDHMILMYFNPNKNNFFLFDVEHKMINSYSNTQESNNHVKLIKKYSIIENKLNSLKRSLIIDNKDGLQHNFILISILIYGSSLLKSNLSVPCNIEEYKLSINLNKTNTINCIL